MPTAHLARHNTIGARRAAATEHLANNSRWTRTIRHTAAGTGEGRQRAAFCVSPKRSRVGRAAGGRSPLPQSARLPLGSRLTGLMSAADAVRTAALIELRVNGIRQREHEPQHDSRR